MKFAPLLLSFLFASITISAQVNPQCPNISVTGPAGIPRPGELIPFTVTVKPTESKLSYKWTVSTGVIVDGQGTPTIRVRRGPDEPYPTATVEIGGLADDCVKTASETGSDDSGITPRAKKLETFPLPFLSSINNQRFQSIADAISNDPTSQTYIFIPARKEVRDALIARLDKVIGHPFDPPRITLVETNTDNKIIEIWLVPPGADAPKCEKCEKAQADTIRQVNFVCPKIDVEGPLGVTMPGYIMTFNAKASSALPDDSKLEWTVSAGTIDFGQGTARISVRVPDSFNGGNIKAAVTMRSLTKRCSSNAEQDAPVASLPIGEPVDTYGKLSLYYEYARVQNGVTAAMADSESLLVIIRRSPVFGPAERIRVKTLEEFIVKRLGFPRSRLMIINKHGHTYENIIWLVPPGAKFPE
jgi:hypothetical protein